MSLAGMPSMSTLLKLELPPRMNIDVTPPLRAGLDERDAGHQTQRFEHVGLAERVERVVESSTVTGAPICDGSTSVAAAVTETLCSSGPIGSATSTDTLPLPPTNIGSVVRVWKPGALASI